MKSKQQNKFKEYKKGRCIRVKGETYILKKSYEKIPGEYGVLRWGKRFAKDDAKDYRKKGYKTVVVSQTYPKGEVYPSAYGKVKVYWVAVKKKQQ